MKVFKKQIGIGVVLVAGMLAYGMANADTVVMGFDEQNAAGEYVADYYDGGCGSAYGGNSTTCGGPNYGVVWNGALAGGAPNGLWGNVADEPSQSGVMGFLDTNNAYMNVAAGFDTGFSFYYSAPNHTGSITVYDGLNGSGNVLATLDLAMTADLCDGIHNYSCWDPIGVAFNGTAKSVSFAGTANYIVFDNVTLGSDTPGGVPEPGALGMFGLGALLVGAFVTLRRRTLQS